MLVGWVSFAGDPIGCVSCLRTRLLWLPPRVAFFLTSDTHTVIARLRLLLLTPLALSPQKATPIPITTLALSLSLSLSLSLLRRSLARSVCSDVPAGLSRTPPPATRALRIALNFSCQKAGAAVGRSTACAMTKGASGHRPRHPLRCCHGCDATSDPPPRDRARLAKSPHQGGN
jgi:hypothetical protein